MDLEQKITNLLNTRKEGNYWDFKEEWHYENKRLIHDVLCFANTIHHEDCYIIIGVSDNGEIVGLDGENRRKQADIINIFNNLSFGESAPRIGVKTILFNDLEVDVLIIYNSIRVPYYLSKSQNNGLPAGLIYSRNEDGNTPIDKSTNIEIMEKLWRKRFSLDRDMNELFKNLLLNKDEWVERVDGWYHRFQPEFSIAVEWDEVSSRTRSEFYCYELHDTRAHYGAIKLMKNQNIIDNYQLVGLDGKRYTTPVPEWGSLDVSTESYNGHYKFYIKDTMLFNLHRFLIDNVIELSEEMFAYRKFIKSIVVYSDSYEKNELENYISNNSQKFLEKINVTDEELDKKSFIESDNPKYRRNILEKLKVGKLLNLILENKGF